MRQKPIFGAFAPRGEKGSRERLKRLAEVLPGNTWNKTSLKMKNVHIGLTQHCGKLEFVCALHGTG